MADFKEILVDGQVYKVKDEIARQSSVGGEGTVTAVKMNNGTPIEPNENGVVDLGTVITDVSNKVDKETGKGLSSNDYTDADKTAVATIPSKANDADVVKSISVNGQAQQKNNGNVNIVVPTITMDDVPTAGSNNAVKSGGIKTAIDNATPTIDPTTKKWIVGGQLTNIVAEGQDGRDGRDGQDGNSGVASADGIESVNNLDGGTTDTAEKVYVLGANMGKEIADRIAVLGGYDKSLEPSQTLANKYIVKPGTVSVGATASISSATPNLNATLSFYPITGGELAVSISKTPGDWGMVLAFATSLSATTVKLASTDIGNGGSLSKVISGYPEYYKYLVIGYVLPSTNVVTENIPAIDLDMSRFVNKDDISKPVSISYNQTDCTIANSYIKSNGAVDSASGYKCSDYLDIPETVRKGKMTFTVSFANSNVHIAFYSESKSFISSIVYNGQNSVEYSIPGGACYIRLSTYSSKTLSVIFADNNVQGFLNLIDGLAAAVENIEQTSITEGKLNISKDIVYNADNCTNYGQYVMNSGAVYSEPNASNYRLSGYLPVYGGVYSYSRAWTPNSSNQAAGVAFYTKDKGFISGHPEAATEEMMPANAAFIRLMTYGASATKFTCSASGIDYINDLDEDTKTKPHYNILTIGNSFCQNMLMYLQALANSIGVPNVTAYNLVATGTTLSNRWSDYTNNTSRNVEHKCGTPISGISSNSTMPDMANHNWDVIIFQLFNTSTTYNTVQHMNALTNLVAHIRHDCPNKNVRIGIQMEWTRVSGASIGGPVGSEGHAAVAACCKQMLEEGIIDFVVPTGTAVINAALNSTLNTRIDQDTSVDPTGNAMLLEDKLHLADGLGKYLATCTLWETVIRPLTGKSISDSTLSVAANNNNVIGSVAVTSSNRGQAHMAVFYALARPYEVSVLDFTNS